MDEYDDGALVSLALIPVNVYSYTPGYCDDGILQQGRFDCIGLEDVNPIMIESVAYVETSFSTYQRVPFRDTMMWIPFTNYRYEETVHPVAFYEHHMASGRVILTVEPLVPMSDDHDIEQPFHTDNIVQIYPQKDDDDDAD